jgi:hypothetical protein
MGSWIRIRIRNADQSPEGGKSAPKKESSEDQQKKVKKLVFSMQSYFRKELI